MTAIGAALVAFFIYIYAYRRYGGFLSSTVFQIRSEQITPAHTLRDDVDFVPTKRSVLFGHHFASITGLAPMLGPAVAVIWGWLPALVWVVFGSVLIGCVHDFSALVVSLRAEGKSIGVVAEGIMGRRAKTLFLFIILFGVALAMGVFVFVIAQLFSTKLTPQKAGYPQAALPSLNIMVLAVLIGWLSFRKGYSVRKLVAFAFPITLASVFAGMQWPTFGLAESLWPSPLTWIALLLVYALAASILPVWSLLQPRDFLNSLLLYLGLLLCYLGFFLSAPEFQAPAVRFSPQGAPPLFPFVFIIIACGAVSGFHGLVSSGTTSKQLDKAEDAKAITYGGMIGESLLGLLAVFACTCGFPDSQSWAKHYANWNSAQSLATKLDAFIQGSASFLNSVGIPTALGATFMAVIVVSFALTTLDSATRLLRYNIEELAKNFGFRSLQNRFASSSFAVFIIGAFALYKVDGKPAALALWELFGTTNQLLAGLTLVTVTLYLKQRKLPIIYTLVPAIVMMMTTLVAMTEKLLEFWQGQKLLLFVVGGILLVFALWILVEGCLAWFRKSDQDRNLSLDVFEKSS
ncbi:MAG: carbon starvation protein A [Myxococcales bacterium]|nr:MAG: carbon starvation protein A [Myxococcales bacterium]